MTEQTAVLREDPPLLPPPASPDRAHRVPGDRTAIPGLHDPVASARVVVEVECGILVYPPEEAGEPWRAVFTENGRRRFRQAMTEAELAAKLEKVTERLRAGAPDMERPGADLIAHYLDPDRLPVSKRWSRRERRTCCVPTSRWPCLPGWPRIRCWAPGGSTGRSRSGSLAGRSWKDGEHGPGDPAAADVSHREPRCHPASMAPSRPVGGLKEFVAAALTALTTGIRACLLSRCPSACHSHQALVFQAI